MTKAHIGKEEICRFQHAKDKVIGREHGRKTIGTLGEKTIHAIVKNYYCPEEEFQEVHVGKYHADIFKDGMIIEVQTRNFNKLREKLDFFLQENDVTIVYPIPRDKWLIWIDSDTGETTKPRKSPKRGNGYDAFAELYKIKPYLDNKRLRIKLLLIDMEEYRIKDGWSQDGKKGSHRFDRVPMGVVDEIMLENSEDYKDFIPDDFGNFTSKDLAKATKLSMKKTQVLINVLNHMGCIQKIGKSGRSNLYVRKED